jgi:hypothetical protein
MYALPVRPPWSLRPESGRDNLSTGLPCAAAPELSRSLSPVGTIYHVSFRLRIYRVHFKSAVRLPCVRDEPIRTLAHVLLPF